MLKSKQFFSNILQYTFAYEDPIEKRNSALIKKGKIANTNNPLLIGKNSFFSKRIW